MLKPDWLNDIAGIIPAIQAIALTCDEPFQEKCFELLLLKVLGTSKSSAESVPPQRTEEKHLGSQSPQDNLDYQNFLADNNLSHDMIERLIDFESGKIITRNLRGAKAQSQRIIACLIAVRYAAIEGEFKIPRDDLRQRCESLSCHDSSNFNKNMKNTHYNDSMVFDDKEDFWKVTRPGMGFVASTIRDLLDVKQI